MLTVLLLMLATQSDDRLESEAPVRYRGSGATIALGGALFAGAFFFAGAQNNDFGIGRSSAHPDCDSWGVICSRNNGNGVGSGPLIVMAIGAGLVVTGLVWLGIEWLVSRFDSPRVSVGRTTSDAFSFGVVRF